MDKGMISKLAKMLAYKMWMPSIDALLTGDSRGRKECLSENNGRAARQMKVSGGRGAYMRLYIRVHVTASGHPPKIIVSAQGNCKKMVQYSKNSLRGIATREMMRVLWENIRLS